MLFSSANVPVHTPAQLVAWNRLFGLSFSIQILQNLLCQWFFDFDVSGDRFHCTIFRIDPKGM
jgi:hypothetical protein